MCTARRGKKSRSAFTVADTWGGHVALRGTSTLKRRGLRPPALSPQGCSLWQTGTACPPSGLLVLPGWPARCPQPPVQLPDRHMNDALAATAISWASEPKSLHTRRGQPHGQQPRRARKILGAANRCGETPRLRSSRNGTRGRMAHLQTLARCIFLLLH